MSSNDPESGAAGESDTPPEWLPARRVHVDAAALSHPGHVRPNNEDHYLVARFGRFLEPLLTNLPESSCPELFTEEGHAMLVADGMGGAAAGEIASRVAVETLLALLMGTPDWVFSTAQAAAERVGERMAERYREIDAALVKRAQGEPKLAGMGTTLTLACSFGLRVVLAHIGDSRAYLLRRGNLHQLTRDHTLEQSLVDSGLWRADQAATLNVRHVLTRVLGGSGGTSEAELNYLRLTDDDRLLLCSDGLTDMVDDAFVAAVLREAPTTQAACQSLVDQALDNGGRDNVTVALAHYRFVPPS